MPAEEKQMADQLARAAALERYRVVPGRRVIFACRAEEAHATAGHGLERDEAEGLDTAVGEHAIARRRNAGQGSPRDRASRRWRTAVWRQAAASVNKGLPTSTGSAGG